MSLRSAEASWSRAQRDHQTATAALLETLSRIETAAWSRNAGSATWSPAQLAEHLVLNLEAMLRELASGEVVLSPRAGPGVQSVLRWILLPHILFHSSFPFRMHAAREAMPSADGLERAAALERLSDLALRFERAVASAERTGQSLRHPYFGSISPLQALRFSSVHLEHHRRELARTVSRG